MASKTMFIFTTAAVVWTTGAAAQAVSAAYPESIASALRNAGYKAELTTDSTGDPMINSAASGWNYRIVFYGCENNRACQDLVFTTAFDMDDGMETTSVNSWNRNKLVGRVYVDDERDPFIDHLVIGVDGMSEANFERLLRSWDTALSDFTDYIDW